MEIREAKVRQGIEERWCLRPRQGWMADSTMEAERRMKERRGWKVKGRICHGWVGVEKRTKEIGWSGVGYFGLMKLFLMNGCDTILLKLLFSIIR